MVAESKANKIWEDIKDLKVEVYGLHGKRVSDVAELGPTLDAESLYLKIKGSAVLPAIEEALNNAGEYDSAARVQVPRYVVDVVDKWVVVKANPKLAYANVK